jgi:hypothetical protein
VSCGVTARIGAGGRYRDTSRALDPVAVNTTTAAAPDSRAARQAASA